MSTERNKAAVRRFREAFNTGDLDGADRIVSRLTFRGTHAGDLMGIAPTGKSVTVSEIIIDRFADGKIIESWRLFDQMAMMQQLGVIQAPGQGGS
jgi:predicted ester cyclase